MSLRPRLILALVSIPAFAQIFDVTAPVLQSLVINPESIDIRPGARNVTFTVQISDDLSGVTGAAIYLFGPNNQWRRVYPSRTSGTPLSGTYTAIVNFPQYFASGDWEVGTIYIADEANNLAVINIDTLAKRGFPTLINVDSTPDLTPPKIERLEIAPMVIDTSAADVMVTVRMRLTDTESGLGIEGGPFPGCECAFELLKLVSPSGRQKRWVGNINMRLESGNRNDGVWVATFVMPRYSESGDWKAELTLIDTVHNRYFADSAALTAVGMTSTIQVTSSSVDLEPPTLTSFRITPARVENTATGRQTVALEFGVRDNLGGINFEYRPICPPCLPVGVALISPSGNQRIETLGGTFTRLSGNAQIGTWGATVTFPQFSEAGTWSVDVYLRDRNENDVRILQPALQQAKFPSTLDVFRPSYIADGVIPVTGGVVEDKVFGSRARLTIPEGALVSETSISLDVLQAPPNVLYPQGFSNARTRFVNIELVPHPKESIGDPGYTITIPLVDPLPPGTPMTLMRLDVMSGALIPAVSVNARNDVTGTVDQGGQSATFTGIASFSTVVALVPSIQKPGDLNNDGLVSCADASIVRAAFGKRTRQQGFDSRADVNRDGIVDVSDLAYVLRQLPAGSTCQ